MSRCSHGLSDPHLLVFPLDEIMITEEEREEQVQKQHLRKKIIDRSTEWVSDTAFEWTSSGRE